MSADDLDRRVRVAAFQWLNAQKTVAGEILSRQVLEQGFQFEGERIPVVGPRGIFKPKMLRIPLSITTTPGGPYDDELRDGSSVIHYRYQGTDAASHDNVALRSSTPAVLWTVDRPQEKGIHVHVYKDGRRLIDDTFGRVRYKGGELDRTILWQQMTANTLY